MKIKNVKPGILVKHGDDIYKVGSTFQSGYVYLDNENNHRYLILHPDTEVTII